MDVSMITEQFPPETVGGMGVHADYLSKALKKQGVNVEVITPGTKSDRIGGVEIKRIPKFPASYMEFLISEELQRWADPSIMTGYLQFNILAAHFSKYNIVHCHDWLSVLAGAMAKDLGKKFVLSMHSTEDGRQGHGGSHIVRKLEHMGGRVADAVITVSEYMKGELERIKFPPEKIKVIYNGIDNKKFSPRVVEKKDVGLKENPTILFIGRLDWVKGIDTLVKAMSKTEEKAQLVVLGVGGWQDHLKGLAKEVGVGKRVKFINKFVSEKERINLIAASDICCFPSRYEPFGIVALEGIAMAKPTIVGDRGGLKEIITREDMRVNPDSSTEIAKKIDLLLKDESLRKEVGKWGVKRASRFDWNQIAKQTKKVYRSV